MEPSKKAVSRRTFIGTTATVAAGTALGGSSLFGAPAILKHIGDTGTPAAGVSLGVITYSFRSMADQSAEAILQYVLDSGLRAIELMGDTAESFAGKPDNPLDRRAYFGLRRKQREVGKLDAGEEKQLAEMQQQADAYRKEVAQWRASVSPGKFREFRSMYDAAGVRIYAFKPAAFGMENTEQEMHWGMETAKILGASHVTLEHPGDDAHTMKLGRLAKKHGVYVAYHGHEQQTPTFWDTALNQSAYNALNLDLGHYVAAGNPAPLGIIRKHHDRIRSMHLKDRQTPAHGKGNLAWGSGDTPIAGALQLMKKNNYSFPATIELEYDIPEGSDAVGEVKKCLEFCRQALG